MISDFIKAQLDNLAKMIGGTFGMIDDAGTVLFCSEGHPGVGDNLFTDTADSNAVFSNSSFLIGDYICHQATLRSENSAFLFIKIPADDRSEEKISEAEKLLELASYALAGQEINNDKRMVNLSERLFSGEASGISLSEVGEIFGQTLLKADAIRIITVIPADQNERDAVESVIHGIFSPDQGFATIPYNGRILVICPVNSEITDEVIKELAGTVRDTVSAEVMTDVSVAVSGTAADIFNIRTALSQAERAYEIGRTFELEAPYWMYDDLGLEKFIFSFSDAACIEYVKETFGNDFFSDKASRELLNTVKTFMDCNQNGSEAARKLYIHRNTMLYRLDKFNKITGLDCANFNTGFRIRLAMMVLEYIEKRGVKL